MPAPYISTWFRENLVAVSGLHPRELACKTLTTCINAVIGAEADAIGGPVRLTATDSSGLVSSVSTTVPGSSRTLVVDAGPAEAVAVSRSSSQHGYSWSGAVTVPLATPTVVKARVPPRTRWGSYPYWI